MGKRKQDESPFDRSPLTIKKRRRKDAPKVQRKLVLEMTYEDVIHATRTPLLAAQHVVDVGVTTAPVCCGVSMVLKSSG